MYKQKSVKAYIFRLDSCMCTKMDKEIHAMSNVSCQVVVVVSCFLLL
jgi:hypothetical protein